MSRKVHLDDFMRDPIFFTLEERRNGNTVSETLVIAYNIVSYTWNISKTIGMILKKISSRSQKKTTTRN